MLIKAQQVNSEPEDAPTNRPVGYMTGVYGPPLVRICSLQPPGRCVLGISVETSTARRLRIRTHQYDSEHLGRGAASALS